MNLKWLVRGGEPITITNSAFFNALFDDPPHAYNILRSISSTIIKEWLVHWKL
jgi:hypothetical protein